MIEPLLRDLQCLDGRGLHRMAYWQWGDAANPKLLLCVHGLSRQGRDFDTLARALAHEYRVVCPDVVGRGRSDWLADPTGYVLPTYVADMVTLLARLDGRSVDLVGTSMGGLIGMSLASLTNSPVRRLVINDVGPAIQAQGLQRIAAYIGRPAHWASLEHAADALWSVSQGFGPHTREQWLALTMPQLKPAVAGGGFVPRADPDIGVPFRATTPELAAAGEALLWHSYDQLRCPTLLLRGAQSDILSHETAQAMTRRGARAQLHEFAGVGHAPTLVQAEQIDVISSFLRSP